MATYISPKDIKADKTYQVNGVTWNEYLLKNHNVNNISLPPKRKEDLLGITVHCTNDLENVEDDGRQYTAATLNGAMGGVCTTLYIDDLYAWQNLDLDSMNYTCGDKMGWGNSRTISLEVIMNGTTGENNLKAKDNAARIAAFLLHKYGKTANDLYTHNYWLNKRNGVTGSYEYMCTTKTPSRHCPYYILTDGNNGWDKFRRLVDQYLVQLGGKSVFGNTVSTTMNTVATNKTTPVKYVMKSLGIAAIRNKPDKSASLLSRAVKGRYYLVESMILNDKKEKWLKHTDTETYSMYEDGDVLFSKVGNYKVYTVITNELNTRSSPSMQGNKMRILSMGTTVYGFDEPTTSKDGYDWLRVVYNGKIEYVAKQYLKEKG